MSRYIDADKLYELIRTNDYRLATINGSIDYGMFTIGIKQAIDEIPTADVAEVRHGEWVENGYYGIPCVCSCCGAEAQYTSTVEETFDYDWEENLVPCGYEEIREYIKTPFCPNCGAKMDGDENG